MARKPTDEMLTDYVVPDRAVTPLAGFLWGKPLGPEYPGFTDATQAARDLLGKSVPIAVAEELRELAEYYGREYRLEHQRANRLANSGQKWQYEAAVSTAHTLRFAWKRLVSRADALDPEGAR